MIYVYIRKRAGIMKKAQGSFSNVKVMSDQWVFHDDMKAKRKKESEEHAAKVHEWGVYIESARNRYLRGEQKRKSKKCVGHNGKRNTPRLG